jgi:serine/threonine protein phosphatase PrpC
MTGTDSRIAGILQANSPGRPNSRHVIECFGSTRVQSGRLANEDALVIEKEPVPHAAIFDGAGNAEQAAHRVARFFKTLVRDQIAGIGDAQTWARWVRLMDSQLLGGSQSTFVGVAVPNAEDCDIIGAYAGNSRAYIVGEDGVKLVTAEISMGRLGSGHAQAKTFSLKLRPYDVALLMSDGAWGAYGSTYLLRKTVMSALGRHFSEVPQAILDGAAPTGEPADDMTVIALRQRRLK